MDERQENIVPVTLLMVLNPNMALVLSWFAFHQLPSVSSVLTAELYTILIAL